MTARRDFDDAYTWPPVASIDDYKRAHIDHRGRPHVDGQRVTVAAFEAFKAEWAAFYKAHELAGEQG